MYTISRNGVIIASIACEDVRMDLTGQHPVVVFIRGDDEATLDVEQNNKRWTPYWDKGRKWRTRHERELREQKEKELREWEKEKERQRKEHDHQKDSGHKNG